MKKIFLLCLCVFLTACVTKDVRKEKYIQRHVANYDAGYLITREDNPKIPGTADVYDAEDFRAGALAACNEIQKHYGEDLCTKVGYWGVIGPRVTPEQNENKLNLFGL
jgi:hypothetical protein